MQGNPSSKAKMIAGFALVNEDVMHNIFSKLPALSFASAACVNKTWNKVCSRILSTPKLASALSLNPSLNTAVNEVLDKVLSEPIRPHFAIACIGKQFSLEESHRLIVERLGSRLPIVTNAASGIIGVDAATDKLQEVKWELVDEDEPNYQPHDALDRGIVLVIGYLPGLKVDAIPLLRPKQAPQASWVNQFVMNIRNYNALVSDCSSPAGIILFGNQNIDMKPILATMDWAMPEETVIVGDASGCFLCSSADCSRNYPAESYFFDAVALVFARDRNESHGVGEIQFHVTLSTGVMPFGPQLKAVCVVAKDSEISWLTARMDGQEEILHGQGLLNDIIDQFEDEDLPDLYIGVMQPREHSNDSENLRSGSGTSLAFYEVLGGDNEYVVVNGVGIKPGDSFLFYHSDSDTASSSCGNAYRNLKDSPGNDGKKQVFGGFIFSSHPHSDSFPFSKNFPGVPLTGVYCSREIGRGFTGSTSQDDDDDENSARCCLHVYSTVYLVMSYVAASLQEG